MASQCWHPCEDDRIAPRIGPNVLGESDQRDLEVRLFLTGSRTDRRLRPEVDRRLSVSGSSVDELALDTCPPFRGDDTD